MANSNGMLDNYIFSEIDNKFKTFSNTQKQSKSDEVIEEINKSLRKEIDFRLLNNSQISEIYSDVVANISARGGISNILGTDGSVNVEALKSVATVSEKTKKQIQIKINQENIIEDDLKRQDDIGLFTEEQIQLLKSTFEEWDKKSISERQETFSKFSKEQRKAIIEEVAKELGKNGEISDQVDLNNKDIVKLIFAMHGKSEEEIEMYAKKRQDYVNVSEETREFLDRLLIDEKFRTLISSINLDKNSIANELLHRPKEHYDNTKKDGRVNKSSKEEREILDGFSTESNTNQNIFFSSKQEVSIEPKDIIKRFTEQSNGEASKKDIKDVFEKFLDTVSEKIYDENSKFDLDVYKESISKLVEVNPQLSKYFEVFTQEEFAKKFVEHVQELQNESDDKLDDKLDEFLDSFDIDKGLNIEQAMEEAKKEMQEKSQEVLTDVEGDRALQKKGELINTSALSEKWKVQNLNQSKPSKLNDAEGKKAIEENGELMDASATETEHQKTAEQAQNAEQAQPANNQAEHTDKPEHVQPVNEEEQPRTSTEEQHAVREESPETSFSEESQTALIAYKPRLIDRIKSFVKDIKENGVKEALKNAFTPKQYYKEDKPKKNNNEEAKKVESIQEVASSFDESIRLSKEYVKATSDTGRNFGNNNSNFKSDGNVKGNGNGRGDQTPEDEIVN